MSIRTCAAALLLCLLLPVSHAQPRYSAEQLQQDLQFMQQAIERTHPDPGHSVDAAQLRQAYRAMAAQLRQPMTRDEAWRTLATLNPLFADAHLVLRQPDWLAQTSAHLKAGGTLFPYEVQVDEAGDVYIRSGLGAEGGALAGARIERIDGRPARDVAAELLARAHGDTPAFRANLVSQRWWFLYWKMYGEQAGYELLLDRPEGRSGMRAAASGKTPALLADAGRFERQFRFELLADKTALMTVNTFYWPDKQAWLDFTQAAFAAMRAAGSTTLLIDVRANGGGNDDMWIDGILRYVADRPYRWASSYRKKVIAGRVSATEKLGDVVSGEIAKWLQPEPGHPLHFSGRTYVLTGRATYSSAILFSNVMQDFGFGQLVGQGGYARARQSGGTQGMALPHTGLVIGAPRLVFERPSAAALPALLRPDIVLPDPPNDGRALVDALLARLAQDAKKGYAP